MLSNPITSIVFGIAFIAISFFSSKAIDGILGFVGVVAIINGIYLLIKNRKNE